MMKKQVLILVCFLVVLSGIGIVNAETYSETMSSPSANYLVNYTLPIAPDTISGAPSQIYLNHAEASNGMRAFIHYIPGAMPHEGSANAAETNVNGTIGSTTIFTGKIGYNNVYNGATFLFAYVYVTTDNYNIGTFTGVQRLNLTYDHPSVNNMSFTYQGGFNVADPGATVNPVMIYGSVGIAGGLEQTVIVTPEINVPISFTRPNGLGGTDGTITKNLTAMAMRAIVFSNGAIVGGDSSANNNAYTNVSLDNAHSSVLNVGLYNSVGVWVVNSSTFFTGATTTPTPTLTPYPTTTPSIDSPIPEGYIRSKFQCVDSETDGAIHECQISIYNINNASWFNGTWYGTWFIDTLPGAMLNGYGTATGYSDASRLNVPASSTLMYELIMHPGYVPTAGTGKVRLYVVTNDRDWGTPLNGATVTVSGTGEYTQTATTSKSGSVSFEWTNESSVFISVSKAGYFAGSKSFTTTSTGPDTVRVELTRETVTTVPTATAGPGGTTPVYADPRSNSQKDQDLMTKLRDFAPSLIDICLLMTVIYLVGGRK